jgi:hypothetical protein
LDIFRKQLCIVGSFRADVGKESLRRGSREVGLL